MSSSLVSKNPHIQMNLRYSHGVGLRTVEVKTLVEVRSTLQSIGHVTLISCLSILTIPARGELDIQLQL